MHELRVILIGGSSHAGKSTLAAALAARLGGQSRSTDYLARHPGRPWRAKPEVVPPHVAEHYLTLSVDELLTDVLRHYRTLWPTIASLVATHAADDATERLVLEGSALWPESVATLPRDNHVAALWLTASPAFFRARIYRDSHFAEAMPREQAMIQKFLERTLRYNERMMDAVNRLGLASFNVEESASLDKLGERCLELLGKQL
jgi:2-phosphoglycerate kinase